MLVNPYKRNDYDSRRRRQPRRKENAIVLVNQRKEFAEKWVEETRIKGVEVAMRKAVHNQPKKRVLRAKNCVKMSIGHDDDQDNDDEDDDDDGDNDDDEDKRRRAP